MQHDYIQNLLTFNPTHRFRVFVRTESVFILCSILHSLFDMHHSYFQKKNVLTFDPTAVVECLCKDRICACPRVGRGTVGKTISTMIAAFVIPFNFDMQHDHGLKKLNIDHILKK